MATAKQLAALKKARAAKKKAPVKKEVKKSAPKRKKNPVDKKWIFQGTYKGRPAYLKIMPDEYGDGMRFDDERAMVFVGQRSKMETILKHLKWAGKDRPEQTITDTLKIVDVTKK